MLHFVASFVAREEKQARRRLLRRHRSPLRSVVALRSDLSTAEIALTVEAKPFERR